MEIVAAIITGGVAMALALMGLVYRGGRLVEQVNNLEKKSDERWNLMHGWMVALLKSNGVEAEGDD